MKYDFFAFINYDQITPLPATLYDMGVEYRQNDPYYFDNKNRLNYNGFLFQYTLSGHGIYEDDTGTHILEKNAAFITCVPNDCRYYLPKDTGNNWEFFYIHFDGTVARQFYDEIVSTTGNVITLPADNPVIHLLLNEYEMLCRGKQYKKFEAGVFTYKFLSYLLREISAPNITEGKVKKITSWINDNYTAEISLADLSKKVGITPSHLSRLFYKQMGIKPSEYLTNVRLEHSMQLLTTTTLEINEIAVSCGFANGNYFSKVFRHKLGITPSEYRNNH